MAEERFLPLNPMATVVVDVARRDAEDANQPVRVEHLLRALLRHERDSYVGEVLAEFGVTSDRARDTLPQTLNDPETCSVADVLRRAFIEAEQQGDTAVCGDHFVVAMVECGVKPLLALFTSPEQAGEAVAILRRNRPE